MISDHEYQSLARFRRTIRRFLHFSENAARAAGLTPQQHQALLAVRGHPEGSPSVGDLADSLQLQPHSAAGLVDRLVRQELVTRVGDAKDRRRVLVHITPRGAELLESLTATHREELRRLGPDLRVVLEMLER